MNNKRKKHYDKSIKINYKYVNSPEAIKAVDAFFDEIFDKLYKNKKVIDMPKIVDKSINEEQEIEIQWQQFQPLELTFIYNTL